MEKFSFNFTGYIVDGGKVPKGNYLWGKNNRNKRKIIYAGYWYNEHKRADIAPKGTSTWRCSHTRQEKCKAKVRLLQDESLLILGTHTHAPVQKLYTIKALEARKKKLLKKRIEPFLDFKTEKRGE